MRVRMYNIMYAYVSARAIRQLACGGVSNARNECHKILARVRSETHRPPNVFSNFSMDLIIFAFRPICSNLTWSLHCVPALYHHTRDNIMFAPPRDLYDQTPCKSTRLSRYRDAYPSSIVSPNCHILYTMMTCVVCMDFSDTWFFFACYTYFII